MDASPRHRSSYYDEALTCMSVAELTRLIKDAEAALARKKESAKPSWWKRREDTAPGASRAESA